jgi:hypothetical protein
MLAMFLLMLAPARADVPPPDPAAVVTAPAAPPAAAPEPVTVNVELPPQVSPIAGLVPSADLPLRGPASALLLLVLTGVLLGGAGALRRLGAGLRPVGLLPGGLSALDRGASTVAVLTFFGALVALVPPAYAPALPWMILAIAAALGWSARDVLPDLIAGLVVRVDGRVRVGQRLIPEAGPGRGLVTDMGLLSTTLEDGGAICTLPNRRLLSDALRVEDDPWPEAAVWLTLPDQVAPAAMRAALSEAALTTPWGAPGATPQIQQDPSQPQRWRVVMRVLDDAVIDDFQGTLRERVLERLPVEG